MCSSEVMIKYTYCTYCLALDWKALGRYGVNFARMRLKIILTNRRHFKGRQSSVNFLQFKQSIFDFQSSIFFVCLGKLWKSKTPLNKETNFLCVISVPLLIMTGTIPVLIWSVYLFKFIRTLIKSSGKHRKTRLTEIIALRKSTCGLATPAAHWSYVLSGLSCWGLKSN